VSGRWILLSVVCLSVLSVPVAAADSKDDGPWTFKTGLDARLRYEFVDQDGAANDANAVTLRTRLSFAATRARFGAALVEFEDVRAFGSERFNSTANGMTAFPVVADPDATELNRAWYSYVAPKDVTLKVGRQKIVRDKGRFIGDVGWRQNQQTFDALTAGRNKGRFNFWFAYLARAKRIFGDQHPNPVNRQFKLDGYAGEGQVSLAPGSLTGIVHYLDFENDIGRSHRNIGVRWLGSQKAGNDAKFVYRLEYLDQAPHADGNSFNEAEYFALEAAYKTKGWGVGANVELLTGDGVYGFQRPLATLHAYNGWADRFLNTPATGLEDMYLTGNVKLGAYKLGGQFHRFKSDTGSTHFGDELGLVVSHKCGNRFDVMLKYANHMAKDVGVDVQKVWLSVRFADTYKLD
jgi:hypothetical protein